MTNQEHPITPPPELVEQWTAEAMKGWRTNGIYERYIATQAAQWGADRELEDCCEWFICDWTDIETADKLRAARRPKPPSPKEEALRVLENLIETRRIVDPEYQALRHALEALPND